MSAFHDVLFPLDIGFNSEGGPSWRTEIVALVSGREARNSPWAQSRRSWNAGYGVKSMADIERVIAFFEARRGRLFAFRFRDPFDWKSCPLAASPAPTDQVLAQGDGVKTIFELTKTYESGGSVATRRIFKPVAGSVSAAIDGVATPVVVNHAAGTIAFAAPPPAGAVISAGFLFDAPARFDADALRINLAHFRAGAIPSIPLIEVLP